MKRDKLRVSLRASLLSEPATRRPLGVLGLLGMLCPLGALGVLAGAR